MPSARPSRRSQFVGGWEVGCSCPHGAALFRRRLINPAFFGTTDALHALLRDSARYGVMAVGMTFVIVNKDIDLSVGSTYGLVGVVFAIVFSPSYFDLGLVRGVSFCVFLRHGRSA